MYKRINKEIFVFIVFIGLIIGAVSCVAFGTESEGELSTEMVTELSNEMTELEKRIEKVEKTISASAGEDLNIEDIKKEIRKDEKFINTIDKKVNKQVQNQVTKQNNSIFFVIGVLVVVLGFSLIRKIVTAWIRSGNTFANFFKIF